MKLIILNELMCKWKYIPTKKMHSSRVKARGQVFSINIYRWSQFTWNTIVENINNTVSVKRANLTFKGPTDIVLTGCFRLDIISFLNNLHFINFFRGRGRSHLIVFPFLLIPLLGTSILGNCYLGNLKILSWPRSTAGAKSGLVVSKTSAHSPASKWIK